MTEPRPQFIVDYVDATINFMTERPACWGALPSVELQVLRLLEVRLLAVSRAEFAETNLVCVRWRAHLGRTFKDWGGDSLSACVDGDLLQFSFRLSEFCEAERKAQDEAWT